MIYKRSLWNIGKSLKNIGHIVKGIPVVSKRNSIIRNFTKIVIFTFNSLIKIFVDGIVLLGKPNKPIQITTTTT